jgi:para-aminobenzoate synthetase/4-amino-4-deoxychorismate lyase
VRAPLDCTLAPERVLRALRHEPRPFARVGDWAGGGAILGARPTERGNTFETLDRLPDSVDGVEIGGGWFGWLGYRLGARIERLPPSPPRPVPLPDADLAFYDHVLRQDADGRWWFEALRAMPQRLREIEALLAHAPEPEPPPPAVFTLHGAGHTAIVAECVERIAAGELFQANLCLRLDAAWDGDIVDLFAAGLPTLRPAYAACFDGVASFSPELFLRRRG